MQVSSILLYQCPWYISYVLIITGFNFLITVLFETDRPAENFVLYGTNIFQWKPVLVKIVSELVTAVVPIGLDLTCPALGSRFIMLSKTPQSQQLKIALGPPSLRKKKKKISGEKIAYLLCIHRLRLLCWVFTVARYLFIFFQVVFLWVQCNWPNSPVGSSWSLLLEWRDVPVHACASSS